MLLRMYTRWAEQHGFKVEYIEETAGRGGRHQVGDHRGQGPQRLWLAQDRERRAPAGAHLAVRFQRAPAHLVRQRERLSGDRRPHQDRHQGSGRAHRHAALERRRRPARQQDRIRRSASPTSRPISWSCCQNDRSQHRNRAQAWQMLRARLYELELKKREEQAAAEQGGQDRHRLGPPDPLLRAAALSDGEGPAHRRVDLQHRRRARRRLDPIHGGGAGAKGVRHRAGRGRGRGVKLPCRLAGRKPAQPPNSLSPASRNFCGLTASPSTRVS